MIQLSSKNNLTPTFGRIFFVALLSLITFAGCKNNLFPDLIDTSSRSANATSLNEANTEWTFTEKPLATTEGGRLKTSLRAADFDPVGLRAVSGQPLSIYITETSGTGLTPQLIVGSYDRETVQIHNLAIGTNLITPTNSGDLYIRFASASPSDKQIHVSFLSGFQPIPMYVYGETTHEEWISTLAADTNSPNVIFVGNRFFATVSKTKAVEYVNENQDAVIQTIDTALSAMSAFAGLDNTLPQHASRQLKIMITERSGGYLDATEYRIRITTAEVYRVLQLTSLQTNGWGVYHEFGHQHQMYQWTWNSVVGEVVPNIYTLRARRLVQPTSPGLNTSQWNNVTTYLARPDETRIYESSAANLTTRLGAFHQLYLAFGDDFYVKLHKLYRTETFSTPNDQAEKELFMINASVVSGYDLSDFFRKWGFTVPESVYDEIAALGLPSTTVDLTTLRD